jgi:hypothetical protein
VKDREFSRREWLRLSARAAAGVSLGLAGIPTLAASETEHFRILGSQGTPPPSNSAAALFSGGDPTRYRFTRQEDAFLEEIENACFQFFWNEANPTTGLVKDRRSRRKYLRG